MKVDKHIVDFFDFLERKDSRRIPSDVFLNIYPEERNKLTYRERYKLSLKNKLLYFPDFITKEDLNEPNSINLAHSDIVRFPDNIKYINANLDFNWSKLEFLPDDLTINGYLDITHTNIKTLPNNLTVNSGLYASHNDMDRLPYGLSVGKSLCLYYTKISELPYDIYVGEDLSIEDTPFAVKWKNNLKAVKKKYNIKGHILI